MVKPAKTKKQARKRYYKKRYYKRRYSKKARFRLFKKGITPEIRQIKGEINYTQAMDGTITHNRGTILRLMTIGTNNSATEAENVVYNINNRPISGNKIKLKWLYIKGYYRCETSSDATTHTGLNAEVNLQIKIFRLFKNLSNAQLNWGDIIQNNLDYTQISTDDVQRQLLYLSDLKNDLKGKVWIKTKKLYRKYNNINTYIPFKIRIPLYDAVVQCDCYKSGNSFVAYNDPSSNGLYLSVLSPEQVPDGPRTDAPLRPYRFLYMRYKLYYTDN